MSEKEITMQFPYVVQTQYEHRTTADTHLQHHFVLKNKSIIALDEVKLLVLRDTNMPQGWNFK